MKKYIYLDLFHLSLVLSLLRLYPNLYRGVTWDAEPYGHEVYLGDSTAYTQARFHNLNNNRLNGFVHPKNIDDEIEHSLFIHDVNSLCRRPGWNCNSARRETNIFAYIVNELQPQSVASTTQESEETDSSEPQTEVTAAELTQADMDLIEVLWKQDIDMGVAREMFDGTWKPKDVTEKPDEKAANTSTSFDNLWHGLNYSIDSETGEHVVLPMNDSLSSNAAALVPNTFVDISLEEALSLFESENLNTSPKPSDALPAHIQDTKPNDIPTNEDFLFSPELPYANTPEQDRTLLEQLQDLQEMVSEAQVEPFNVEQLSTLNHGFTDISPNDNSTENNNAILDALLQNTTLALPMNESLLNTSYHSSEEFSMDHDTNINTLLSFLTNDTDPNPIGAVGGQDQHDLCPDLPIANLSVDTTFLSQLLNEGNMDFTDFCDFPPSSTSHGNWPAVNATSESDWSAMNGSPQKNWPASTSTDSAVSSMGSDWSDSSSGESSNGDSGIQDSKRLSFGFSTNGSDWSLEKPLLPTPKKYQLFGKQQAFKKDNAQTPEKEKFVTIPSSPDEEYREPSSTESPTRSPQLAFVHNHTYHYSGDAVQDDRASQKPLERDKKESTTGERIRASRDEKRLNKSNLPLTVKEIVELPIELFNERLAHLTLSEEHLNLIRDIRRRGKNKLAARTCRKRKVDQICELQDVLNGLYDKRDLIHAEVDDAIARRDLLKQKYQRLYQFIFPDHDPPEPVPSSLYFQEDSVVPPSRFPLSSNGTSGNETDHKKPGKHKGASK